LDIPKFESNFAQPLTVSLQRLKLWRTPFGRGLLPKISDLRIEFCLQFFGLLAIPLVNKISVRILVTPNDPTSLFHRISILRLNTIRPIDRAITILLYRAVIEIRTLLRTADHAGVVKLVYTVSTAIFLDGDSVSGGQVS
jgi:hypothetical protein